ncbi:MAG: methyltransferase domain-containing protein [Alphaproteobacteria bacterium]|nr:methyltransferase domain-containing protein [Alphaproteobacteria bacterium]
MMGSSSHNSLNAFSRGLLDSATAARLAREAECGAPHAALYLRTLVAEAHLGLNLLHWAGFRDGMRVLEVGAGAGFLTAFLQASGVNLTAIEPVAQGFDITLAARTTVAQATGSAPSILTLEARQLDAAHHGLFDLIFSVNVVEHFQPLAKNLDGMRRVMAPGGIQAHTCPNYRVPYEPHYGIILLPFVPACTPFATKLRRDGLWRSLNFITAGNVRHYGKENGLNVTFQPGLLAEALRRLQNERVFAERHPEWVHHLAAALDWSGLTQLLSLVPAGLATPMTFRLQRKC